MQISNTMDTASLVTQLMAVERIPQDQLRQRVTALQSKQTAWSQIGSQVTSLQTAAEALAPLGSVGKLMTASSTNDASVAVRVTGVASASTSNIEVLNLATTHAVVSTDTFTDATAAVGGRTLTLTVGGTPTTFTSADGSVGGLVDAVNASGGAVRAKLLQTAPDTYKMVLTATKSGAAAAFTAGGTGWTGLTTATTGVDANVRVDGIAVSRSSNVVGDLIGGVELTLRQPTVAPVQVSVARDDDALVAKVQALVDAANSVITTVKRTTATSSTAAARGVLAGDSTAQSLADEVRNSLASGITGADGVVRPASTLGISLTRDGAISFDAAKLRASLASDPTAVTAMLGRGGSSTVPNVAVTSVLSSATPGPHAISVTQIASAAAMVGVPVPAPPAGSTINLTVNTPDGTVTVTFAAGASYAQTAANLTQAMTRSGLSLDATTDGASFSLSEKRLGSKYAFSVTAGGADLGLSGAASAGNDAQATIDGRVVTGNGQSILNDGTALTIGVTATQLSNAGGAVTGTYNVSDGLAGLLARVGGKSTTATATTAKSGLDSQIKDLKTRIDRYDDTLKSKEVLLRRKFTAMDTVLTRLQSQMTSLTSFTNKLG
jgi:flagellar hook-associated protein 2